MIQKKFTNYFARNLFDKNISLSNFSLLKVRGDDCVNFLQGQLTINVEKVIADNQLQNFCIVDLKGQIEFCGAICFTNNNFLLLTYSNKVDQLKIYFEKYIITEEVELFIDNRDFQLSFFPHPHSLATFQMYPNFYASFQIAEDSGDYIDTQERLILKYFLGSILFTQYENEVSGFLPSSFIHDQAVSFDKGCFKGQEILSKIEFNRKAANKDWIVQINGNTPQASEILINNKNYEILNRIKFNDLTLLHLQLPRELRLHQFNQKINIEGETFESTLYSFPLIQDYGMWVEELGSVFFEKLSELYIKGIPAQDLIEMNEMCLRVFPKMEEFYESIAQFLKKNNQFKQAIFWMNELTKINPNNVLAYTNRSLLYMNLGEIEKAEEEKAKGVSIEFKLNGKSVDEQAQIEKTKFLEREKREKQKIMFLKVLELDEHDLYANLQMTRISRLEKDYFVAEKYLEKIKIHLEREPQVSLEYALLYQHKKDRQKMQEMINLGLPLANKKGNLKVASQLQNLI
ncbi:hypothetical protein N9N67_08810 [Bacteriovoracaceae bacterium]|nr:hypothetical protein [Bacteriovoracaceae bacterium]